MSPKRQRRRNTGLRTGHRQKPRLLLLTPRLIQQLLLGLSKEWRFSLLLAGLRLKRQHGRWAEVQCQSSIVPCMSTSIMEILAGNIDVICCGQACTLAMKCGTDEGTARRMPESPELTGRES